MTIQYTLETTNGSQFTKEVVVEDELSWYDLREQIEAQTGCEVVYWIIKGES